jgi:hypothetical protein
MTSRPIYGLMALTTFGLLATSASAQTFSEALAASKPLLESRLRYESVEQQGLKDATALTWRNRFGFQTGEFRHLKLLVEVEDVRPLVDDYNSGFNGKTAYAGVGDPEVTEINRAQLSWTPSANAAVVVGRQRIVLDDGRFVGNSGWRQDEQTFDALRGDLKHGKWTLTYAYVYKVNRVTAEAADWDADTHLISAAYTHSPALKLQAYDYAIRLKTLLNSNQTAGVRVSGDKAVSKVRVSYAVNYAKQGDFANNPQSFDLATYSGDVSAAYGIATYKLGYEVLEGNGVRGFVMPLATNHAFRGWADAFSTAGNKTLPDGIKDLSLGVTLAPKTFAVLKSPTLSVIWHDFDTERLTRGIGHEWDAQATTALTKNLTALVKYADFERASTTMPASRSKVWLGLEYKL